MRLTREGTRILQKYQVAKRAAEFEAKTPPPVRRTMHGGWPVVSEPIDWKPLELCSLSIRRAIDEEANVEDIDDGDHRVWVSENRAWLFEQFELKDEPPTLQDLEEFKLKRTKQELLNKITQLEREQKGLPPDDIGLTPEDKAEARKAFGLPAKEPPKPNPFWVAENYVRTKLDKNKKSQESGSTHDLIKNPTEALSKLSEEKKKESREKLLEGRHRKTDQEQSKDRIIAWLEEAVKWQRAIIMQSRLTAAKTRNEVAKTLEQEPETPDELIQANDMRSKEIEIRKRKPTTSSMCVEPWTCVCGVVNGQRSDGIICYACGRPLRQEKPVTSAVSAKVSTNQREDSSIQPEFDYESLTDEPVPYKPPERIESNGTKRQIMEVGRVVDKLLNDNLKLLFERTVCRGQAPKLIFENTSEKEKESIERAFGSNRPDFVSILATCCTAQILGRTIELSPRKHRFFDLYQSLIEQNIPKLRELYTELLAVLSYGAYAVCYGRYLEHGGKVGLLFTPYLGYVRALNRGMSSEALRAGSEIEKTYAGRGCILSMFSGLTSNQFFVPISDNPNVFKIPELVIEWFMRNVPSTPVRTST